jgi:hypothetical protein
MVLGRRGAFAFFGLLKLDILYRYRVQSVIRKISTHM